MAIHSATASFKDRQHYFEILGGRFTGHGPVSPFEVTPVVDSTLFEGISAFTVKDELYLHDLQPGITPHFTAMYEGEVIPVVWTYCYGKGRVCYAVPGHRAEAMRDPNYQRLLKQGLIWVSQ